MLLRSWGAILVVVGILMIHIWLATRRRAEILLVLTVTLLGVALDSTLMMAGAFVFEQSDMWPGEGWLGSGFLCPVWLIGIWIVFATTIGSTLRLLEGRQWLAPCLGAIAAPLAYFAGMRLGAMEFGWSDSVSMATLAIIWAILLPLIFSLYRFIVSE